MEKRFLIAITLSFLVLMVWSSIFHPPSSEKNIKSSQIVENNKLKNYEPSANDSALTEISKSEISQRISNVENDKLLLQFSNVGGILKSATIKEYGAKLPVENILNVQGYENIEFNLDYLSPEKIVYSYEDSRGRILKTYNISKDDYIVQSEILYNNKENKNLNIKNFSINTSNLNLNNKNDPNYSRDRSLFEYVIKSDNEIYRKGNAFKFTEKDKKQSNQAVDWVGFRDRYYCVLVKSEYKNSGYETDVSGLDSLSIVNRVGGENFNQNGENLFKSTIFIGPEKLELLKKYNFGFEKIKKYYRFGLFDAMGKIVYALVHSMHKIFPNWGVCIILISTLICFVTYPFTMSSMVSMKKMQALQPKIGSLREKYKNNPQKLNKEIVELYKENKVNPLGGCLPLLLQMPIFIGLYQALWRDVDFKGAHFLWIKDLSGPDRLFIFPFSLPFLGNEFNILPILMIVIMFIQQKLSSKNMVLIDPAQIEQQKMMGMIMPIFLGVIFYKFASGLNIYFTFFYAFSTFNQWKIYKQTKVV